MTAVDTPRLTQMFHDERILADFELTGIAQADVIILLDLPPSAPILPR